MQNKLMSVSFWGKGSDARGIIWFLFNRKEVKGRLDTIGMPFRKLCQEAEVYILQVCTMKEGTGQ